MEEEEEEERQKGEKYLRHSRPPPFPYISSPSFTLP